MTKTAKSIIKPTGKKETKKTKKSKNQKAVTFQIDGQPNVSEAITCTSCKTVFTEEDAKILCCDRCELWYCAKCANISDDGYKFLSSTEGTDVSWYCKPCKLPAKTAVLEHKTIEDKCKEFTEILNQRLQSLEAKLTRKVESTALERINKRIEEVEERINKMTEDTRKEKTWDSAMNSGEKENLTKIIENTLAGRDIEERDRLRRRKNIIVFGLPEAEGTDTDQRNEDIQNFVEICKNVCKVNINESQITRAVRLGEVNEDNNRPIVIELQEAEMKRELFKNLGKLRESEEPYKSITIAHDMTKKQKEELKALIQIAQQKEKEDQLETTMYRVRGPPWGWYIKKIQRPITTH